METWVKRASQWVTLIGTPVLLTLVATGLFYNKLDTLEDRVASFDARFDSIDKRLNDISTKLEAINDRMTKAETDPLQHLAAPK